MWDIGETQTQSLGKPEAAYTQMLVARKMFKEYSYIKVSEQWKGQSLVGGC